MVITVQVPHFSVVIAIYRWVERIREFLLPPIFCIKYMITEKCYPDKKVNINIQ